MKERKSSQGEGYDFYDYDELAFEGAGGADVNYVVGTNQNAAIQGAWPSELGVYPPDPLYLPVDGQNTMFYADVACLIRLVSRNLAARQALLVANPADPGGLPAGFPLQIVIPATTWITLPDKWYIIYAIAVGDVAGTLIIKTSG